MYQSLNSNGRDTNVDYVMLGCPHYLRIEMMWEAARLLEGKKIHAAVVASGSSLPGP